MYGRVLIFSLISTLVAGLYFTTLGYRQLPNPQLSSYWVWQNLDPLGEASSAPIQSAVSLDQAPISSPPSEATGVQLVGKLVPGDAVSLAQTLSAARFGSQHWSALYNLWNHESGWNPAARNWSSGACGIPQAMPCQKIRDSSPRGQIEWGLDYIAGRYGNPTRAWQHWLSYSWY